MITKVTTTYKIRPHSNVGQIVAAGGGRRKSFVFDQPRSPAENHRDAVNGLLTDFHPDAGDLFVAEWIESNNSGTARRWEVARKES